MFEHGIGGVEALILLLIVIVVFGSKRLPDTARSLGRALRIFKAEVGGLKEDDLEGAGSAVPGVAHRAGELPRFDTVTGKPLFPTGPAGDERAARYAASRPADAEGPQGVHSPAP